MGVDDFVHAEMNVTPSNNVTHSVSSSMSPSLLDGCRLLPD